MNIAKTSRWLSTLAGSLVFSGCGGGSGDTSPETTAAAAPPPATTASIKYAPLVDASCGTYSVSKFLTNQPDNAALLINRCTLPVQIAACWLPKNANNCSGQPESKWFVSPTMTAGKVAFVRKPDATEDAVLAFIVCDMSDPSATCSHSQNGGSSQTPVVKLDDFQLEIYGPNAVTVPVTPVSRPPPAAELPIGGTTVTPATTPPPAPVAPNAPTPVVDFRFSDTLNQSGTYNSWDISVTNTGNVRVLCTVRASYRYLDTSTSGVNRINELVTDTTNRMLLLPVGQTGVARFGFTDRNIQTLPPYTVGCTRN